MQSNNSKKKLFFLILIFLTHRPKSLWYVGGFAYAPNFITKIIQEETGIVPMTEVFGSTTSVIATATTKSNGEMDSTTSTTSTTTSTLKRPTSPVTTRFPPEPNGYLHLGHAKAVSFNFAVARMFGGKCHMRMDDTNPSKEEEEYVQSILEDVKWVQSGLEWNSNEAPWDGPVRKTSDYFHVIYDCAEALIQQGDAYVDSLSAEEMRDYRGTLTEPGKNSPYRNRSVEENLTLFRKVWRRNGCVCAWVCGCG